MPPANTERSIGRLEGKVDLLITKVDNLDKSFHTLEEGRLSTLEHDFANLTGKLSIIAVIVSAVISIATAVVVKIFFPK